MTPLNRTRLANKLELDDTGQNSTQNMQDRNSDKWNCLQTQILDIQVFRERQCNKCLDPIAPNREPSFNGFTNKYVMTRPDIIHGDHTDAKLGELRQDEDADKDTCKDDRLSLTGT